MISRIACCALAICLAGCAGDPATLAVTDAYRAWTTGGVRQSDRDLKPDFKYLRVQVDDRELYMALGYVDQTPEGPVEVWYDSDADALHLRNGRVVGITMKSGPGWSAVAFAHLPAWDAIGDRAEFTRTHDESPGYRYGILENIEIRRIAPPDDTRLQVIPATSLTWFEESVIGDPDSRPARYGVDLQAIAGHQVVYAEQCLTKKFCFSWQSWPYSSKGSP